MVPSYEHAIPAETVGIALFHGGAAVDLPCFQKTPTGYVPKGNGPRPKGILFVHKTTQRFPHSLGTCGNEDSPPFISCPAMRFTALVAKSHRHTEPADEILSRYLADFMYPDPAARITPQRSFSTGHPWRSDVEILIAHFSLADSE